MREGGGQNRGEPSASPDGFSLNGEPVAAQRTRLQRPRPTASSRTWGNPIRHRQAWGGGDTGVGLSGNRCGSAGQIISPSRDQRGTASVGHTGYESSQSLGRRSSLGSGDEAGSPGSAKQTTAFSGSASRGRLQSVRQPRTLVSGKGERAVLWMLSCQLAPRKMTG